MSYVQRTRCFLVFFLLLFFMAIAVPVGMTTGFWFAFGMLCYKLFPNFGMQLPPDGIVGAAIVALLVAAVARFTAQVRTPQGEELKAFGKGLQMYEDTVRRGRSRETPSSSHRQNRTVLRPFEPCGQCFR